MADILAENLSGKSVMGADGAELGMLYNITMDINSGGLKELIVEPDEGDTDTTFPTDEEGRYRVPVSQVQAVRDYIVIER
jgi:sporulation protein YlmC with PRC-barrel domain